ncbi:hypothetical protein [Roseovarius nanhaiticus]|uniref:hypothetical protein n=1 Tax=Roseovarius nanhaiticus TaxID=573024 RepID=UPI00248FAC51|nr:hypothetical protein [Roseovarius nanhaiticus]
MARPRKPPSEQRQRWDKLYVTKAERAEIAAAAAAVDLKVGRYLMMAHRGTRPPAARPNGAILQAMGQLNNRLALLSRTITERADPLDAVTLHADLLAIERTVRDALLPWATPAPVPHEDSLP